MVVRQTLPSVMRTEEEKVYVSQQTFKIRPELEDNPSPSCFAEVKEKFLMLGILLRVLAQSDFLSAFLPPDSVTAVAAIIHPETGGAFFFLLFLRPTKSCPRFSMCVDGVKFISWRLNCALCSPTALYPWRDKGSRSKGRGDSTCKLFD